MATTLSRAIKPKAVFGEPMNAFASTPGEDLVLLGYILGQATGVHVQRRTAPNGTEQLWHGLKGDFEGMPSDPRRSAHRAPICYLPEHIHETIAQELETENGPKSVDFAFEVAVRKDAKSSAGFVWLYSVIASPKPSQDRLAHLKQLLVRDADPLQGVASEDFGDAPEAPLLTASDADEMPSESLQDDTEVQEDPEPVVRRGRRSRAA